MEPHSYEILKRPDRTCQVYMDPQGIWIATVRKANLARRIVAALRLTDHLSIEALESMKTIEVAKCD